MLKALLNEIDTSEKKVKQFAWLFAFIGVILVPSILFYKHGEMGLVSSFFMGFCASLLLLSFISVKSILPLYKVWMLLALVLGLIMTKVIITLVFYLVMTPIGLMKRSGIKKTMKLNFKVKEQSYWVKKEWNSDPKRLEKLF